MQEIGGFGLTGRSSKVLALVNPGQCLCLLSKVEVSLPRRLQMYHCYSTINLGHGIWLLFGGCSLLRESVIRGLLYYGHICIQHCTLLIYRYI